MKGSVVQFIATLILSLLSFYIGFHVAWISYAAPVFESNHTGPELFGRSFTKYETSFLGSVTMLGSIAGCVAGGYIAEVIGRKKSEVLCTLCFLLGSTLIIAARSLSQMVAARFIIGIASGLHMVVAIVYINEFSQESIRGAFSSFILFFYSVGILISYTCGWVFSYEVVNYLMLVYSVISVILVCFLKESPVYLLRKGRDKEALTALSFYRQTNKQKLNEELTYLRSQQVTDYVVVTDKLIPENQVPVKKASTLKILKSSKAAQRALVTVILNLFISILMGSMAVNAYAVQFFGKAAPDMSHNLCSVILALTVTLGAGVSTIVTDLLGRRVLMIGSCIVSTICLGVLGTLLRWLWAPDWVTIATILSFCFAFQMGANNIPIVQIAESFVPELKAMASVIATVFVCIANFILLSLFRPAVDVVGMDNIFFIFSSIGVLTTVTSYLIMKETKGVCIENVQEMYERGYLYRRSIKK